MKLSKRETVLIQALLVMGSVSISALLVVNPTLLKVTELKEKASVADLTILDYESKIEIANSIGNNMTAIKKDAMSESAFAYDSMHNYRVDQIIQEFTNKHGLKISSIMIGSLEGDELAVEYKEYDKDELQLLMESGVYMPAIRLVSVDLSVEASRDQLMKFVDEINTVEKSVYLQSFSLSDGEKTTASIQIVFEELEQAAFK